MYSMNRPQLKYITMISYLQISLVIAATNSIRMLLQKEITLFYINVINRNEFKCYSAVIKKI